MNDQKKEQKEVKISLKFGFLFVLDDFQAGEKLFKTMFITSFICHQIFDTSFGHCSLVDHGKLQASNATCLGKWAFWSN